MIKRRSERVLNSLIALAVTAILTTAVMAQNGVVQKVAFYLDGKVGTEVIKKGTYTVTIPESEQGTIDIKVGKKLISVPFTKRQNQNESDNDRLTYVENSDGTRTVATITPRGRKFTLVLQETGGSVAGK